MKFLILLAVVFISGNLFSQNCTTDEWIKDYYFFDSKILSLREIDSDTNHAFKDSVRLPEDITDKYMGLLSVVYNQHTDLTDSLFNNYSIHIYPYFFLGYLELPYSQMVMKIDTSLEWVKAYIQDSLISGNHKFDSITSLYNFRLKYITYLKSATLSWIESSDILNTKALVGLFNSIDGVEDASPNYSMEGDGDDIQITFSHDTAHIVFSVGWGDCPSGCIDRHYWEFSVQDCSPEFERSYGDPLTAIEDIESACGSVFPNPAGNKIFIPNPMNENVSVLLYTIRGELLLNKQTTSDFIDLSGIDTGVYLLTVVSARGRKTKTIMKR